MEQLTTVIHLDHPSTRADLEARYAAEMFAGDPRLVFEQITPVAWKVAVHEAHTAPIQPEELKRLLRMRLHCRTD